MASASATRTRGRGTSRGTAGSWTRSRPVRRSRPSGARATAGGTPAFIARPPAPPLGTQERLAIIVETMREISRQTDPQVIAKIYGQRMRQLMPFDRFIALSRRDLDRPRFRITRSSLWKDEVNPWKERDRLPLLSGGLFADLIWGDEPRIIDDLAAAVTLQDPAADYLAGMGSLVAIPHYDRREALDMVVVMRTEPAAFDPD